MQTIKINTTATTYGVAFGIMDGNFLGAVGPDKKNPGKWGGHIDNNGLFAGCFNRTFAEAVEYISDAIENHFAAFGLNVEFVNA